MSYALHTERLILRPPGRQDLGYIVPFLGDFSVSRNLARAPHPYTEKDGRDFLLFAARGWVTGSDFPFAILLKNARVCIGMCGVHPSRNWEFGYWIGRPYWGRGYATEAARAVTSFAFGKGAEKLTAHWFHDNPASGRVLQKLGFKTMGEEPSPCLARGGSFPSHVVALDRATRCNGKLAA
jgi:RimJ/RimL family protein N-acetyltransferase